ncbi:MAG: hypothetical protein AABZ47_17890 [Planctomycetota bacterium]
MTLPRLSKTEWSIVGINGVSLAVFSAVAIKHLNLEFILYVGVVSVLSGFIFFAQPRVKFGTGILCGLTLWGMLHLAGGNVRVNDSVLYGYQLIPVVLRYDQFVHAFGFGIATLVCHHLLLPTLSPDKIPRGRIAILTVLMGCGLGAFNEILEFVAVKTLPETHVGGYENTLWDLVFNQLGALMAVGWLMIRRKVYPSIPKTAREIQGK